MRVLYESFYVDIDAHSFAMKGTLFQHGIWSIRSEEKFYCRHQNLLQTLYKGLGDLVPISIYTAQMTSSESAGLSGTKPTF